MQMSALQSLLYGLVSGLSEFLPISSRAHQDVLLSLFGHAQHDPVRDFLIHISALFALLTCCRDIFAQFQRENRNRIHNVRSRRNVQNTFVVRLIRTAALPLVIGLIVISYIYKSDLNLLAVSFCLLINGLVLYIPCRMLQGNKDAYALSVLDGWIIGLSGAFSVFSGISLLGCVTSSGVVRGADRRKALNWALLLSVPALIVLSGLDVFKIFFYNGQINFWGNFFGYILSLLGAGIGSYVSAILIRFITSRTNYAGFAYYCWGFCLFSFIMYLLIV